MNEVELIEYYLNLNNGDLELGFDNPIYPKGKYYLSSRDFKYLHIAGNSNCPFNVKIIQGAGGIVNIEPISPLFIGGKKNIIEFSSPKLIKIELTENALKTSYAKLSFLFSNTR